MNITVLKKRMGELGMNTTMLIRKSGVSESTVKRIMRGKYDVHTSTLRMIAAAVDLSPSDLLDEDLPPPDAFDPANVPEIAAEVLEQLTEIAQDEPNVLSNAAVQGQMTPGGVTNGHHDSPPVVSPECEIFYERMISYLRAKLDESYIANEQTRSQNTELIKANAVLHEQDNEKQTKIRSLYTGIIIACIVAGLAIAGFVAYFLYDIMSPSWGIIRY